MDRIENDLTEPEVKQSISGAHFKEHGEAQITASINTMKAIWPDHHKAIEIAVNKSTKISHWSDSVTISDYAWPMRELMASINIIGSKNASRDGARFILASLREIERLEYLRVPMLDEIPKLVDFRHKLATIITSKSATIRQQALGIVNSGKVATAKPVWYFPDGLRDERLALEVAKSRARTKARSTKAAAVAAVANVKYRPHAEPGKKSRQPKKDATPAEVKPPIPPPNASTFQSTVKVDLNEIDLLGRVANAIFANSASHISPWSEQLNPEVSHAIDHLLMVGLLCSIRRFE